MTYEEYIARWPVSNDPEVLTNSALHYRNFCPAVADFIDSVLVDANLQPQMIMEEREILDILRPALGRLGYADYCRMEIHARGINMPDDPHRGPNPPGED